MHKDSTGQMMNQVISHFNSNLGSHVCAELLFQCGKKCVYLEEYEGFSSEQSINIPNGDLCCGCRFHWTITTQVHAEMDSRILVLHLTMSDHKRDLVMKSFWPVFVMELGSTDMRLCHKACALLLEWFLVALSHGKVLFSDDCTVYCSSLSWNVFGAKQNPCYKLEM